MLSMGNYSETESYVSASTYLSLNESIPNRDSIYVVIPITVIYFLILICGVFGNVITCIVICRNRSMHTATNFYLLSLSVSDLLLLVTGLPQEMYSVWSHYPYIFGEAFCILRGLAAETSANATVLTITAFTVERYVAICHPFLSHTLSKLSRAIRLIILIWIIAFAFAIPSAAHFGVIVLSLPDYTICAIKRVIFQHYFELLTILFFVMPMTLITVLYVLIAIRLRQSNKLEVVQGRHRISSDGSESSRRESRGQNNVGRHTSGKSSRRVIKMLVVVVAAFFICWAPFHAQRLVAMHVTNMDDSPDIYSIVTYVSGVLYYISTAINPLLYNIMSHKFREAFKREVQLAEGAKNEMARIDKRYEAIPSEMDTASNCYGCLFRRQDEYTILAKASRREKCEEYCSRRNHRKVSFPSSSRRLTLTNKRPDETSSSCIITIPMTLVKSSNLQAPVIREYQAWLEEWRDGGSVRVAEEALGRFGRGRNVMMMLAAAAVSVLIAGAGRADTAGTICGKLGDLVWPRRNRVVELREADVFGVRRGS